MDGDVANASLRGFQLWRGLSSIYCRFHKFYHITEQGLILVIGDHFQQGQNPGPYAKD
jgi:hypothetical protein